MEARKLRDKPCLGRESVTLAQHAFEQTWVQIAPRFAAGRHAEVREALAFAVMEAIRLDSNDIAAICEFGLQVMERMYPIEMHMSMGTATAEPTANDSGRTDL
jgi:hypothetical protein